MPDDVPSPSADPPSGDADWVLHLVRTRLDGKIASELALYCEIARRLNRLGRQAEADSLLIAATQRFPGEAQAWLTLADLASIRLDWPEARQRWRQVVERFPEHPFSLLGLAREHRGLGQLGKAEALLSDSAKRIEQHIPIKSEWADVALRRRDWPEAERRWQDVAQRWPGNVAGPLGLARAVRDGGRLAEADALFEAAVARFPDDRALRQDWADCATRQRRWGEALRRWELVVARQAADAAAALGRARCLRHLGRFGEADAVLSAAVRRYPDEFAVWRAWADSPGLRRNGIPALARWDEVRRRFPNQPDSYTRPADVHHKYLRHDAAANLLAMARQRLPDDLNVALAAADNAEARGELDEAHRQYRAATERFGQHPAALSGLARTAARAGRHDEARAHIEQAVRSFPDQPLLRLQSAELALAGGDLADAAQQWRAIRQSLTESGLVERQLHKLRWRMLDFGVDPQHEGADATSAVLTLREIAQQFESLGGIYEGCEFATFQSYLGAEPLGLLRWATGRPQDVIAGLNAEFAGVGEPEQTLIEINDKGEYMTSDRLYGMGSHTFVYVQDVDRESIMRRVKTRLQFLRRKFLEDLKRSDKIFIYKYNVDAISLETIRAMRAALSRHSTATLFIVRRADAEHPFPTVEFLSPGVMIGYMDQFSYGPDGKPTGQRAHESWSTITRAAFDLWRAKL